MYIGFVNIAKKLLKRWKYILLSMVLFSVLFAIVGVFIISNNIQAGKAELYGDELDKFNKENLASQANISILRSKLDDNILRQENNISYNLETKEFVKARILIYVDLAGEIEADEDYRTEIESKAIMYYYNILMTDITFFDKLAEKLDIGVTGSILCDTIKCTIDNNILDIDISAKDMSLAEKIVDLVISELRNESSKQKHTLPGHTLNIVHTSFKEYLEGWIGDYSKKLVDEEIVLEKQLSDAIIKFEERTIPQPVEVSHTEILKESLVIGIIGLVFGAMMYVSVFSLWVCLRKKVMDESDLTNRYNIRILGFFENSRKG